MWSLFFIMAALIAATSSMQVPLAGQCPPESSLKIVNFNPDTINGDYYNILTTKTRPAFGISSTRSYSLQPDQSLMVSELAKLLTGEEKFAYFSLTSVPDTNGYMLNWYGDNKDGPIQIQLPTYWLLYDDEADVYATYSCKNNGADMKQVQLSIFSRKKTQVDLPISKVISEFVSANNLTDAYAYTHIIQQTCCQIDEQICSA